MKDQFAALKARGELEPKLESFRFEVDNEDEDEI